MITPKRNVSGALLPFIHEQTASDRINVGKHNIRSCESFIGFKELSFQLLWILYPTVLSGQFPLQIFIKDVYAGQPLFESPLLIRKYNRRLPFPRSEERRVGKECRSR